MTKILEERILDMKWVAETDSIFVRTTNPKEDYSSFGAARGRQEQAKDAMKIIKELQDRVEIRDNLLEEAKEGLVSAWCFSKGVRETLNPTIKKIRQLLGE